MIFITHILFGIVSGFLVSEAIGSSDPLLFILIAAIAALIPDIDIVTSFLGRRLPFFSILIGWAFGHRGPFHSIWLPLLTFWIFSPFSSLLAGAITTGIISHILLDATTKGGIKPIWPIPVKISGPFKTGGFIDMAAAVILVFAVVVLFFNPPLPVDTITGYITSFVP